MGGRRYRETDFTAEAQRGKRTLRKKGRSRKEI